jgi:hypothetical protein
MLRAGRRGTTRRLCLALLIAAVLPLSVAAQSPEPDPRTAGSDIVGKLRPVRNPTTWVRIPAAHRQIMEANLQRFVAIVLRDPAMQPPVGFDFRTDTHAYAPPFPVSRHQPLAYTMTGLIYWYMHIPGGRPPIQAEPIAMRGFFLRGNDIPNVFGERWPLDPEGRAYIQPLEIRKVAGYPQYDSGAVVLKRNPRPIWVSVSREWALRCELARARKNLDAFAVSEAAARSFDHVATLEKWLKERPQRQRAMEKSYAEMKPINAEVAEKIRANHFELEKNVEKTYREAAERQKAAPYKESPTDKALRGNAEKCVGHIEGELARLSTAERAAPAYVSLKVFDQKRPGAEPGCSMVVDAEFPGASRIVRENPDYYDPALSPSAIQLILADFSNFEVSSRLGSWRHATYERIRDRLDYPALAAMLKE